METKTTDERNGANNEVDPVAPFVEGVSMDDLLEEGEIYRLRHAFFSKLAETEETKPAVHELAELSTRYDRALQEAASQETNDETNPGPVTKAVQALLATLGVREGEGDPALQEVAEALSNWCQKWRLDRDWCMALAAAYLVRWALNRDPKGEFRKVSLDRKKPWEGNDPMDSEEIGDRVVFSLEIKLPNPVGANKAKWLRYAEQAAETQFKERLSAWLQKCHKALVSGRRGRGRPKTRSLEQELSWLVRCHVGKCSYYRVASDDLKKEHGDNYDLQQVYTRRKEIRKAVNRLRDLLQL